MEGDREPEGCALQSMKLDEELDGVGWSYEK